ncbi:MAG: 2-oxoacid:acceptor oxidoreductase family protein [Desulfobacteraceae bacterium]
MNDEQQYQIVISGVGGQGVLFVTRLLAEAAIGKGLPVFTSETHGMAQRGGTVISHLKVGRFTSPLIMPGAADGLIALKAEGIAMHGGYLKSGAWAAVNSPVAPDVRNAIRIRCCDADRLAKESDNPRALNLIMLGFALAGRQPQDTASPLYFCTVEDVVRVLESRLKEKKDLLGRSINALSIGAGAGEKKSGMPG